MKFGVCVNLLEPGGTGISFAKDISRFGYDYIELPLGEMLQRDEAELLKIRETLKELDLKCLACNNFMKRDLKLVGPDVDRAAIASYCERALQYAATLGATRVGLGSPWAKSIPDGFSREKAWEQMLELCCTTLGPLGEKYGITVALEHNNKTETNHLNYLWEIHQLVEEVSHPNIKTLTDYYHLCIEDEPMEGVVRAGANIRHIHFAKIDGRRYPKRLDEDDRYAAFIDAVRQIGYDDCVSIEAYSEDFQTDGAAALQFFRENFG